MTFEEQLNDMIQNYDQVLSVEVVEYLRQIYNNYEYWNNQQINLIQNAGHSLVDDSNNFEKAGENRLRYWRLFEQEVTKVQEAILESQGFQR